MLLISAMFLLFGVGIAVSQQICPPADLVLPCTCTEGSEKKIRCADIRGRFDIKDVFDRLTPLIADNVVFDTLEIFDTSLLEIPSGSIQTLKFLKIDIMSNRNLEYISPDAFNATTNVTVYLSLWLNYLSNNAPYERDIFDFFNKFTKVESIWLPNNRINSIPDNAFGPLLSLNEIYLGSNSIRTIGANAFSQLTGLRKVWLSSNQVSNDGISPTAFAGVNNNLDITLESNTAINHLQEAKFKPLLDNALKVTVGARHCGSNGCTYTRLICDQEANWICRNTTAYRGKLNGFLCQGVYEDVWSYCAELP